MDKCKTCGQVITIDCDWQQGRCPHRTPTIDIHHLRFYTIIEKIKSWFRK